MKFKIPNNIIEVLSIINSNGYEAYIVGGSVRDLILNKKPNDYDITTNARPKEIKKIFKDYKTVLVGEEFGTVLIVFKGEAIEITTYRIESGYKDKRRPENIEFTLNLQEDLSRRDFTINALAYHPKCGVIDYFGGLDDLKNRKIKTVGNPYNRFNEDGLRLLRCIRFSSQLNFEIEDNTFTAVIENSENIKNVSNDRIRDELFKILLTKKPSHGIRLLNDSNLLVKILPELSETIDFKQNNPYHDKDVFNHTLCVLDNVDGKIDLRLAALFHDIGKTKTYSEDENQIGHFYNHEIVSSNMAYQILRRLNTPKKLINKVQILIENHMRDISSMKEKGIRRLIYKVGKENIMDLYNLNLADKKCTHKGRDIKDLLSKKEMIINEINSSNIFEKNKLKINGYDIIKLGIKQGKLVGQILDELINLVIDNPELNDKKLLLEIVKDKYLE